MKLRVNDAKQGITADLRRLTRDRNDTQRRLMAIRPRFGPGIAATLPALAYLL